MGVRMGNRTGRSRCDCRRSGYAGGRGFWQTPGEHQVRLSICGNSGSVPVSVKPTPEPAVTHPGGLCPGAVAQVQTTAPFAAYKWTTAGGALLSTAAAIDAGPGHFALTVTDAFGCTGITAFDIQEYPLPNISISTSDPTGFCDNSRFVTISALVAGSGNYSFEWFKDGAPLKRFPPSRRTPPISTGNTAPGSPIRLAAPPRMGTFSFSNIAMACVTTPRSSAPMPGRRCRPEHPSDGRLRFIRFSTGTGPGLRPRHGLVAFRQIGRSAARPGTGRFDLVSVSQRRTLPWRSFRAIAKWRLLCGH